MAQNPLLRVALAHDCRITFDICLPFGAPVTIGRDPECAIILRGHAPARHELFLAADGHYALRLIGVLEARIQRAIGLQQIKDNRTVPLLPTDRGVVYLAEPGTRILFEFVAPPGRRSHFDSLRRTFGFGKP